MYEGDYSQGKWHGKGITYYDNVNNTKSYEGDFLQGRLTGKGIKYYLNGKKMYEGDYSEDKCHGKGIKYYDNGKKLYEGDFFQGIWHGKGIKYYDNVNNTKEFEGDWSENEMISGTFVNRIGIEFFSKDLVQRKKRLPVLNVTRRISKRTRKTINRHNL